MKKMLKVLTSITNMNILDTFLVNIHNPYFFQMITKNNGSQLYINLCFFFLFFYSDLDIKKFMQLIHYLETM